MQKALQIVCILPQQISKLFSVVFFSPKILCFQQTKQFLKINFASSILYLESALLASFPWRNFSYPHYESLLSQRCMIGGKCNLRSGSRKCSTIMKLVLFSAVYYHSENILMMRCVCSWMTFASWEIRWYCSVDASRRLITLHHLTLSIDIPTIPDCFT